ncbi:MAG: hypothetical protein PVG54_09750, partial [Anaerolineae bacterium]
MRTVWSRVWDVIGSRAARLAQAAATREAGRIKGGTILGVLIILGLASTLSSSYAVTAVQAERDSAPGPEVTPRQGDVPAGARQSGNFITN